MVDISCMIKRVRTWVSRQDVRDYQVRFENRDPGHSGEHVVVDLWKEQWADAPMFDEAADELEASLAADTFTLSGIIHEIRVSDDETLGWVGIAFTKWPLGPVVRPSAA